MDLAEVPPGRGRASWLARKYGVSIEAARKWLSGDAVPVHTKQQQMVRDFRVDADWLMAGVGSPRDTESLMVQEAGARYNVGRLVPVLNSVQAGYPRQVIDDYAPGAGRDQIRLDGMIAEECGPYTFALEVDGKSMSKSDGTGYSPGDIVVVDPDAPVSPGDIVVAKLENEEKSTLKKFRDRGQDSEGRPRFELVPLNEDFSTIVVDASNPGVVIGPVVEHRRRIRRPGRKLNG